MATVTGTRRLLDISGNNISTAVSLEAEGTLLDSNGQSGTSNQVLISTATGVDWVDGSGSSIIGGPYVPLSGGSSTGQAMTGTLYGPGATFSVSGNNSTNLKVGDGFYRLEMGRTSIQARAVGSSGAAAPLSLNPNGGDVKFIGSGNVGIGTTSPSEKLTVIGGAASRPTFVHQSGYGGIQISGTATGSSASLIFSNDYNNTVSPQYTILMDGANDSLVFISGDPADVATQERMRITSSGNVEINNGQLSLGGTGRIQGVDTVTDNTDAANKLYVDNAVAGVPQGDITAIVAGSGMTGTSLSGPIPTLNVIGGDGITANADDIEVDSTVVRTTGAQSIAGTKTFTTRINVDTSAGTEAMGLFTENNTAPIADTFAGNTSKSYIYFSTVSGGNDPGFIMHESSSSSSPDERNEGVLHLVPSDDNATNDYVSIHGTNDPDVLKLHTSGLIETVNLQLQLKSGSGSIYLNDGVSIEGDLSVSGGDITLGGTGRIQGVDTVTDGTDAANKAYVDASVPTVNNGTLTMTTNTGLDGGATFTANQSGNSAFAVSLDLSELADMTQTMIGTDEFIVLDNGAERRKAANEIGLSIFNNDSGFLLDTTDTFTGTLTIDGELEMSNGPNGIIYTSDDILTLSSGGKTGGTNIAIDDGGSIIKLNADTIAQGEFKVSSLTDGTGDDVFRALVTSSAASFSLGDIEGIGDGSYIVSDGSSIKLRNNGGVNTLVADNSNNVEIPSGTLTVSGSTTADSLIKDGGTSSQFLKADGSVDSNTYLTTETGARMVQFNRSGINASTYTMLATVNGNNLASILKMTMTGTSGSVVFACTFDITVNHSTDIHVKSSNGDYTEVTLRITSNNNEDFSIEAKHNGGSTTTAEVCIYPLADEVITPTTTDPGYTGAEYEHTATEGWRFGGEDGNVESSNVIVDGKIGVGTTTPAGLLEVKGPEAYIYISDTTETDSGIIFRDVDAGLSQAAAIKYNSSNGKLQFYNNDTAAVRMTIDTAGNVGIGNTGPNYPLVVNGVSAANRFYVPNATATTAWVLQARNSANTSDSGLYFENGDAQLLLRDDSNNLNVRINSDSNSYINGGNLGIGITAPDAKLTVFRTVSNYAISRGDVEARAGLSVKSSSSYDSKLNFATGLNSQQYIQGLNNAATTGRPIVLNPYGGYVGINTANLPTQQLDIISGTNNGIRISATDTQTWRDIGIRSYVTEGQANALADHTFIYTTNPSSGTEDPFGKFGATVIQGRDNGNSGFAIRLGNGGGHATRMWMGGTGATTFSNTVTATNFILSSDERLKENIEQVCDNRVKADWKTFELKTEKGQKRYGVIAQELEKTNPEFVREDSQGFKSVAYIDLLIAKIAELEARLEKLEK